MTLIQTAWGWERGGRGGQSYLENFFKIKGQEYVGQYINIIVLSQGEQ